MKIDNRAMKGKLIFDNNFIYNRFLRSQIGLTPSAERIGGLRRMVFPWRMSEVLPAYAKASAGGPSQAPQYDSEVCVGI